MKYIILLLLTLIVTGSHSQTNSDQLKQINKEVWAPFIEAYAKLNMPAYRALQTKDFIRAEGDNKKLPTPEEYFKNVGSWFDTLKKRGHSVSIDFHFIERFANRDVASERGIYQLKGFDASGKQLWEAYGKFHVFLRKENGLWKIAVDYHSNEASTINQNSFNTAAAMNDLTIFDVDSTIRK